MNEVPEHYVDIFVRLMGPPQRNPAASPELQIAARRENVRMLLNLVWREAWHTGAVDWAQREMPIIRLGFDLTREPGP